MSAAENKELIRTLTDSFNRQDMSVIDELVAVDYVDHGPFDDQAPGREGMKQAHRYFYQGFPDIHETIDDIFAEDDRVVVRWTCRGTHLGWFAGLPPTGKQVAVTGIDIYRIANGQVIENWHNVDGLSLLSQIGYGPTIVVGVVLGRIKSGLQRIVGALRLRPVKTRG